MEIIVREKDCDGRRFGDVKNIKIYGCTKSNPWGNLIIKFSDETTKSFIMENTNFEIWED